MTLNKKGRFLYRGFFFLMPVLVALGCAVQQKPQGGPRDRTPPKLLKATPANQTHNFAAKRVVLDFDEYFKLTNQFQEITVFPAPDRQPEYVISKRSLIINFKDTLHKNTTYVINFGKAIADVNESNILKNFTYVFSTGNHIDSLNLTGSLINTLTQQREKDATVMLFPLNQDSILFGKKKPSIYATTDTSGNFSLSNLKEGDYKIYGLKETSPDKIYDNENELIAFSTKVIHLQHDTSGIQLRLFKQVPTKLRFVDRKFDGDGKMFFTFNKSLENPSVRILYPAGLDEQKIVDISKTKDTVMIYSKNMDFDSVRVAFYENNKPADTTSLRKGRKETFQHTIALGYNINRNAALKPGTDLKLTANTPIVDIDQSLITLKEDSTQVNYTLTKDTGTTKGITIKYRWRLKAKYALTIADGALTGLYGDKNKRLFRTFTLDNPENYSILTLKVTVPDTAKSYIVELLNEQRMPLRSDRITKNANIVYRNYYTGKYYVRVVYDDNKNGKWDSGSIKKNIQPENIWINDKVISLKPNWDAEEPIAIPREVIYP